VVRDWVSVTSGMPSAVPAAPVTPSTLAGTGAVQHTGPDPAPALRERQPERRRY
jgi:hypothetical protein